MKRSKVRNQIKERLAQSGRYSMSPNEPDARLKMRVMDTLIRKGHASLDSQSDYLVTILAKDNIPF